MIEYTCDTHIAPIYYTKKEVTNRKKFMLKFDLFSNKSNYFPLAKKKVDLKSELLMLDSTLEKAYKIHDSFIEKNTTDPKRIFHLENMYQRILVSLFDIKKYLIDFGDRLDKYEKKDVVDKTNFLNITNYLIEDVEAQITNMGFDFEYNRRVNV